VDPTAPPVLHRLARAMNEHDLAGVVGCFAADYRNETPLHPRRGFTGREQVRSNWTQILASVPDLTAVLLRWSDGAPATVWAEWDWSGTRGDGGPLHLAGVTVLGLDRPGADVVRWSRFYMEPVEEGGPAVEAAVRTTAGGTR
jgi:ketosteroid isomerase-like protein